MFIIVVTHDYNIKYTIHINVQINILTASKLETNKTGKMMKANI